MIRTCLTNHWYDLTNLRSLEKIIILTVKTSYLDDWPWLRVRRSMMTSKSSISMADWTRWSIWPIPLSWALLPLPVSWRYISRSIAGLAPVTRPKAWMNRDLIARVWKCGICSWTCKITDVLRASTSYSGRSFGTRQMKCMFPRLFLDECVYRMVWWRRPCLRDSRYQYCSLLSVRSTSLSKSVSYSFFKVSS